MTPPEFHPQTLLRLVITEVLGALVGPIRVRNEGIAAMTRSFSDDMFKSTQTRAPPIPASSPRAIAT